MFHRKFLYGELARSQLFKEFEEYKKVKNIKDAELLSFLSSSGIGKVGGMDTFTFY